MYALDAYMLEAVSYQFRVTFLITYIYHLCNIKRGRYWLTTHASKTYKYEIDVETQPAGMLTRNCSISFCP